MRVPAAFITMPTSTSTLRTPPSTGASPGTTPAAAGGWWQRWRGRQAAPRGGNFRPS